MNENITGTELKMLQKLRNYENMISTLGMHLKKLTFSVQDQKLKRKHKKSVILGRRAVETQEINELCDKVKLKDEKIIYLEQRIENLEQELDIATRMPNTSNESRNEEYIERLENENVQYRNQVEESVKIQDELIERVRQLEYELQSTKRETELHLETERQLTARHSQINEVLHIKGKL